MFNVSVSTYRTFRAAPENISLKCWIRSTMNFNCQYADQVKRYRQTERKQLKEQLPCVTVSAICKGGHKKTDVAKRTGWIALDIDRKDNPQLTDAVALRDEVAKIIFVAFAGLSVSGKGVWALVKVEKPQKQKLYFQQLQVDFQHLGIILDSTKGANPNDLRFYSFDPNAYIADDFKIYDRLPKKVEKSVRSLSKSSDLQQAESTKRKVEILIKKIQARRQDITVGYEKWCNLGFALEDEFGETGRDYFHQISRYHPDYDYADCDKQFDDCLTHDGSGIGIGTFFHVCQEHNITLH